jgi:Leucine-rich repeat (LRR) protein
MKTAIILIVFTQFLFAQGTRESDSLALVNIMEQNPDHTLNWDTSTPLEEWNGVWIHENRVTHLMIQEKNISILPESIGDMEKIEILNISHNSITDLPQSLGNLWRTPLVEWGSFNLSNNTISTLPSSLEETRYLLAIDFSHNQFSEFPSVITQLDSLQRVTMNNNTVSEIPGSCNNMTQLTHLHAHHNNISTFPDDISGLSKLQYLDISYNALTSILSDNQMYDNISTLNAAYNELSSFNVQNGQLPQLKNLHLSGNSALDLPAALTGLENCAHLQALYLDSMNIDILPQELFLLDDLTLLSLAGNAVSQIPPEISRMSTLKDLNLAHNSLSDLPGEFGNLNTIRSLNLARNSFSVLPEEFQNLTDIISLNLFYNDLETLPDFISPLSCTSLDVDSNFLKIENMSTEVIIWLHDRTPEWRDHQRTKTAIADRQNNHATDPVLRRSAEGMRVSGNIPHNTVLNMYSPAGRTVFSAPLGEQRSIGLPALSPGVYSAQLQAEGRSITATLIRIE